MAIRFLRYYVTDGKAKARVSYSIGNRYPDGARAAGLPPSLPCVTLYAQDYSGALGAVLPGLYKNATDSQSDYFDKGHANIDQGHPLYAAARERAEENAAANEARWKATQERRAAKRAGADSKARLDSDPLALPPSAFVPGSPGFHAAMKNKRDATRAAMLRVCPPARVEP